MTRLDRYIAFATLRSFILVAAALTALFSLLEFVEQLSSVGQGHYRIIDALLYVLLTAPFRLLQVTPIAMLLGCLLALGGLASNYELAAVRFLGVSEQRVVGAIFLLALPIILILFLMAEFVIPPAQQFAEGERTLRLSTSGPLRTGASFWAQRDGQYLNVQRFDYGNIAKDVDIFSFDSDGNLKQYVHAARAEIRPDGDWNLTGVVRKRLNGSQFATDKLAALVWHAFLPPNQSESLVLPPESMAPTELYRYVRDLKARHEQALRYEQELWAKISIPLSILAMIMISIPFVFGSPRAQSTGRQITIGAICGMVFVLVQQIASRLDLLLNLNPAVTALGPALLLMGLAVYLFQRQHRWRASPVSSAPQDPQEKSGNASAAPPEEKSKSQ
jgi:lipopolysaccharide export system permease protein